MQELESFPPAIVGDRPAEKAHSLAAHASEEGFGSRRRGQDRHPAPPQRKRTYPFLWFEHHIADTSVPLAADDLFDPFHVEHVDVVSVERSGIDDSGIGADAICLGHGEIRLGANPSA